MSIVPLRRLPRATPPPIGERGATLIEFALASIVLIALFGVIFDIGLGIHRYAMVKQVASDVTRKIAEDLQTHRNCSQVRNLFANYATPQLEERMQLEVSPVWHMTWDSSGAGGMFDVMQVRTDFRVKCFFLCSFAQQGGWQISTETEIVIERSGIGVGGAGCPAVTYPKQTNA